MNQLNVKTVQDEAARSETASFLAEAEQAFDLDHAREKRRDQVDAFKSDFDWEAPERFAEEPTAAVAGFADSMLEGVRSAELGTAHEKLTELRMITRGLADDLEPKGFLRRWFFNARKAFEQFAAEWGSVSQQIDEVIASLERDKRGSAVSIENLRMLRAEAIANFERMAIAVVAGRELLEDRRRELDVLKSGADVDDPARSSHFRALEQQYDIFDRRVTNLEKARSIASGMIPTIQQTLHSEIIVSEELDMALTQAIPVMKQQLALIAEQVRQGERLASLSATRGATEEMMGEISKRLQENQQQVDAQVREGIASADRVSAFLDEIGQTIEAIDQRQNEAQKDRAQARVMLQKSVAELGRRLSASSNQALLAET